MTGAVAFRPALDAASRLAVPRRSPGAIPRVQRARRHEVAPFLVVEPLTAEARS